MLSRGPGQSRFTLAVLVVISITILAVDLLGVGPVGLVRNAVGGALSPVRAAGDALFGSDDSAEVARLREQVAELDGTRAALANVQAELDRLRGQLTLAPPAEIAVVAANVVGDVVSNFDRTIEIDKGADAGIEPGMAVRNGAGLVGVVDSVTFNSARIELISADDLQFGVLHSVSADKGIAHGQGEDHPLLVENGIDAGTEVSEGDVFVTSGVDGSNFPGDIPVGTVISARAAANPLERQVIIEPLADLERLTHVAVLLFTAAPAGEGGSEGEG